MFDWIFAFSQSLSLQIKLGGIGAHGKPSKTGFRGTEQSQDSSIHCAPPPRTVVALQQDACCQHKVSKQLRLSLRWVTSPGLSRDSDGSLLTALWRLEINGLGDADQLICRQADMKRQNYDRFPLGQSVRAHGECQSVRAHGEWAEPR